MELLEDQMQGVVVSAVNIAAGHKVANSLTELKYIF